jgi:hypothetical protein
MTRDGFFSLVVLKTHCDTIHNQCIGRNSCMKLIMLTCCALVMCSIGTVAGQEILHDYSNAPTNGSLTGSQEMGVTIPLGSPAFITEVGMVLSSGPPDGTTQSFTFSLYTMEPSTRLPSLLLWQGLHPEAVITRTEQLFSLSVPSVRVPGTFIFTIDGAGRDAISMTIGSDDPQNFGNYGAPIYRDGDSWYRMTGGLPLYMASIIRGIRTTPEPSSALMLTAGTFIFCARWLARSSARI